MSSERGFRKETVAGRGTENHLKKNVQNMEIYGLIGYPLVHSFSRAYFTGKFQREGLDAEYRNFELPSIDGFRAVVDGNPALRGLNVTLPYKQQVMPFLDELSPEAREIGAVNAIRITWSDGVPRLKGFNADVVGFVRSIKPLLRAHHRSALILGTGGASKAVNYGLHQLGLSTQFVSRHPQAGQLGYADVTAEVLKACPVVVNCTPCGMFPHVEEHPALPYEALGADNLLYDLVYNPEETEFLRLGRQHGAQTKNGLEMLHLQAEASWEFWHTTD